MAVIELTPYHQGYAEEPTYPFGGQTLHFKYWEFLPLAP